MDLHGDVMGTVSLANTTGAITALTYTAADEYGIPLDLNSGGVSANAPPRYGWLGGAQRSGETLGGAILMGSRVYAPGIRRFLSIDPTPGGNGNIYDYCTADPVNCTDLTGNWPDWGAVLNVVAVVAEVVATVVPGPIGTAAGFISAGAYLATGNTSKATEMALVATAQLAGAGLAVKAVQYASKIGTAYRAAYNSTKITRMKVGNGVHAAWNAALRPLERSGKFFAVDRPAFGRKGRPDLRFGRTVFELKPNTASGLKSGRNQVAERVRVGAKRGYVVLYDAQRPTHLWTGASDADPTMRSDRMTVTVETALDRALGRIPDVVFERSGRRWTHAFSADVWWRLTVERDEGWSSTRGLVHVGVVVPAAIELLQGTDMFPVKVSPGNVSEYLCLLMGQRRLQPFDTLHPGGQDRRGWFSRRVSPTSADPVEVLESHLSRFALPWLRAHSDLSVIASTRQRVLGDSPAGYLRAEVAVYTWMANCHDSAMALLDENDRRNQDDRKVLELDKRLRVELPQIGSEADGEASTG